MAEMVYITPSGLSGRSGMIFLRTRPDFASGKNRRLSVAATKFLTSGRKAWQARNPLTALHKVTTRSSTQEHYHKATEIFSPGTPCRRFTASSRSAYAATGHPDILDCRDVAPTDTDMKSVRKHGDPIPLCRVVLHDALHVNYIRAMNTRKAAAFQ